LLFLLFLDNEQNGFFFSFFPLCSKNTKKMKAVAERDLATIVRDNADLVCVAPSTSVEVCANLMGSSKVGCVLVMQNNKNQQNLATSLKGIFSERDILARVLDKDKDLSVLVSDVMTPNPKTVGCDTRPLSALNMMLQGRVCVSLLLFFSLLCYSSPTHSSTACESSGICPSAPPTRSGLSASSTSFSSSTMLPWKSIG
jgi:CBS domain-containing protein